ncbi:MAG: biopolymer transporter ExbD [Candidatus Delongbacteria bacterium]|nr:biopolymer transporter ExbD [Candidatus Delongbacteria bacterium]
MAFTKKEEPRKAEMTSMIDMIFLLLIFFLVTLAVGQNTGEEGDVEGTIENPSEVNIARETHPLVATADSVSGRIFKISIFSVAKFEDIPAVVAPNLLSGLKDNKDYPVFAIYWLDTLFKTPISVNDSFAKWDALAAQGNSAAADNLARFERYRPLILPPNNWFTANSDKAGKYYGAAIENTKAFFNYMKNQNPVGGVDMDANRLTLVLDADEDLYYRFLFDLNRIYYEINPDNTLMTSPIPGKIMISAKSINSR